MKMAQYDVIGKDYTQLAKLDPSKQFVQYPETLRMLGQIKGKKILDAGCGAGLLTRQIARKGAEVIAYDNSTEQITLAIKQEKQSPMGIQYFVADPNDIEEVLKKEFKEATPLFDKAVSTMVLLYAENKNHLTQFFSSTYRLLKNNGIFISITFNPNYRRLRKQVYNRIVQRTDERMKVDFLDSNGAVKTSAYFSDFSKKDYEDAAKKAGFKSSKWVGLRISKEGIKKMGSDFWKDYEKDCPYIGLIVKKC